MQSFLIFIVTELMFITELVFFTSLNTIKKLDQTRIVNCLFSAFYIMYMLKMGDYLDITTSDRLTQINYIEVWLQCKTNCFTSQAFA